MGRGGGRLPKQINKSQPLSLIWPSQSHADLYRPHQQKMLVGDSQRWCGGGQRCVRRGREQAIKQQEERDEGKRKAKIKDRDNGRRIREGRNEGEGFAGLK